jgi:Zn-finger nucleic acid-binding protein
MNSALGKHTCPRCNTRLKNVQTKYGMVWSCVNCKGRAIGHGLLKKLSNPTLIQQVWMRAKQENNATGGPCPACRRPMLVVSTGPQLGSVELDICQSCFFIWFDHQEFEKVPKVSNAKIAKRSAASAPKITPPSATKGPNNNNDDDTLLDFIGELLDFLDLWD